MGQQLTALQYVISKKHPERLKAMLEEESYENKLFDEGIKACRHATMDKIREICRKAHASTVVIPFNKEDKIIWKGRNRVEKVLDYSVTFLWAVQQLTSKDMEELSDVVGDIKVNNQTGEVKIETA